MLAIKQAWECPSCGNILHTIDPFATKRQRKTAVTEDGPKKCGCGRKGTFHLLSFEQGSLQELKEVPPNETAVDESEEKQ